MSDASIADVFLASLTLAGAWFAYFSLYPEYQIAVFRRDLLVLEQRILTLGTQDGFLDHGTSLARLLGLVQGALRCERGIYLSGAVTRLILAPRHSDHIQSYREDWSRSMSDLDESKKQTVEALLREFHLTMGWHAARIMPLVALSVLFISNAVSVRVSCFSLADIGAYLVVLYPGVQYSRSPGCLTS